MFELILNVGKVIGTVLVVLGLLWIWLSYYASNQVFKDIGKKLQITYEESGIIDYSTCAYLLNDYKLHVDLLAVEYDSGADETVVSLRIGYFGKTLRLPDDALLY